MFKNLRTGKIVIHPRPITSLWCLSQSYWRCCSQMSCPNG